jgi:hypothetical protein
MRTLYLAVLVVAGCTKVVDDTADTDADTDTDADSDADTDADTDVEEGCASLGGTVTDLGGTPLTGVNVNMCKEDGCRTKPTDATGAFLYPLAPGLPCGTYAFYAVPKHDSGLATMYTIFTLEPGDTTRDVALADLGTGATLSSSREWLDLDGGLSLEVASTDLSMGFGDFGDTVVASVVPPEIQSAFEPGGAVVAWWYLATFEASADPGMGIRVRADAIGSFIPGDTVEVWNADLTTHPVWLDEGTLTLGDDGYFTGDATITAFTSLVLATP